MVRYTVVRKLIRIESSDMFMHSVHRDILRKTSKYSLQLTRCYREINFFYTLDVDAQHERAYSPKLMT